MNEFAIEWVKGQTTATVTAPTGSKLKNRILHLKEKFPDEVDVHVNDDGSMFAHVPVKWVKIGPPRRMSDEQRAAAAARLNRMRDADEWDELESEGLWGE